MACGVAHPDGGTQNLSLELDARGETVTGNILGLAIREGRLNGSTLTLKRSAPNNQEVSLTGQVSDDEIVFKSTGLPPRPIQFVARRDAPASTGRGSDPVVVRQLMKQFNVPGVSIAVINDFKIVATDRNTWCRATRAPFWAAAPRAPRSRRTARPSSPFSTRRSRG